MSMALLLAKVCFAAVTANTRIVVQDSSTTSTVQGSLWTGWTSANSGVWAGGAIHFDTASQQAVTVYDCVFTDVWNGWNSAEQDCPDECKGGGAIYTNRITLVCDTCHFKQCKTVSGKGGAILAASGSKATIQSCDFTQCVSSGEQCSECSGGGAVACTELQLVIKHCPFVDCSCPLFSGGAIYALGGIVGEDCDFTGCVAGNSEGKSGGAVFVNGVASPSSIIDFTFTSCYAYAAGALSYAEGEGLFSISACKFDGCSAQTTPSCLILDAENLAFESLKFDVELNVTVMKIGSFSGPYTFADVHIEGNRATLEEDFVIVLNNSDADIVMKECSFKNYQKNANSGGGVFQFGGNRDNRRVEVLDCTFVNVNTPSGHGGVFDFKMPCKENTTISGCTFTECTSNGAGGALYFEITDNTVGQFEISNCTFYRNSCGSQGQSIHVQFDVPITSFDKYLVNNCTFRQNTKKYPLYFRPENSGAEFNIPWKAEELVFDSCTIPESGEFLHFWSTAEVQYDSCVFKNIWQSSTYYGAGVIALCNPDATEQRSVKLLRCHFESCESISNGVLWSTNGADLTLELCEFVQCTSSNVASILAAGDRCLSLKVQTCLFEKCSGGNVFAFDSAAVEFTGCDFIDCDGNGGGLFFSSNFQDTAIIQECNFNRNGAPSILVESGLSGFTIRRCIFSSHTDTPITMTGNTQISEKWTLEECNFTDNRVQDKGIIGIWADLTLSHCRFTGNTGNDWSGIFAAEEYEPGLLYRFESCVFERNSDEVGLIVVSSSTTLDDLTITSCTFSDITGPTVFFEAPYGSPFSMRLDNCSFTKCKVTATGSVCYVAGIKDVTVHDCTFTECESVDDVVVHIACDMLVLTENKFNILGGTTLSNAGHYLVIDCQNFSLANNDFQETGQLAIVPMLIKLSSYNSVISGTLFTSMDATQPLFDLSLGAECELEFYNCCFTHTGGSNSAPYFMRINNSGTVRFSEVCFDAHQNESIEVTGNDVIFEGKQPEEFFSDCNCWGETIPTESSKTQDPDEGKGNPVNPGVVAGATVAAVAVVAVLAVVIVLLIRRKKRELSDTTTENFNTATIDSTVPAFDAWAITTEDQPMTTANDQMESPFKPMEADSDDE